MADLSTFLLLAVFVASAGVIWVAGVRLSSTTDALDLRLGLGDVLGGLLLLAFATSLPEVAITAAAAIEGNLELAVGNLIGGIAVQTMLLAVLDAAVPGKRPITYLAGSLILLLEGLMVIGIVAAVILGTQLPQSANVAGLGPGSVAVVGAWALGLLAIRRARRGLPWRAVAPGARPGRPHRRKRHPRVAPPYAGRTTRLVAAAFGLAALATLVAGVTIEESGSELAVKMGLGSGIFGGTVLAAATALPGVSTGIAAVRLGDYQLAISDIFGGNAFAPTLFVLADLMAGTPALPVARPSDVWLAGLGGLLTAVYAGGILLRPQRRRFRLGPDSILVIALYALGIVGLVAIGN